MDLLQILGDHATHYRLGARYFVTFDYEPFFIIFRLLERLSGLSLISLYADFEEMLGSSPDCRDSKVEYSRLLLQFASKVSAEMSKYSSSSATAEEFEISSITLKLG